VSREQRASGDRSLHAHSTHRINASRRRAWCSVRAARPAELNGLLHHEDGEPRLRLGHHREQKAREGDAAPEDACRTVSVTTFGGSCINETRSSRCRHGVVNSRCRDATQRRFGGRVTHAISSACHAW
jgi:hypothetical protein